ncbi:MAG TPA: hypothetical protein VG389_06680 [Myxococcota bacterium]|jgi:hypothetical protein|nr:hypothetical protein [Myxococcota bacterium]
MDPFQYWPLMLLAAFGAADLLAVNVVLAARRRDTGVRRGRLMAVALSGAMLAAFATAGTLLFGLTLAGARGVHDGLAAEEPPADGSGSAPPPLVYEPAPEPPAPASAAEATTAGAAIVPQPSGPFTPGTLVLARRLVLSGVFGADRLATKKVTNHRLYELRFGPEQRDLVAGLAYGIEYDVTLSVRARCESESYLCGDLVHVEPHY